MSAVRIWLVPSRNRRVYGLTAPIAIVLPLADQVGFEGSNWAPITLRVFPLLRSSAYVAPVWSWNASDLPSGDQAAETSAESSIAVTRFSFRVLRSRT